jgi:tetratricopeptide (TPR) repeat protein
VLVALYDGKPVPKVIDFGVAKAAGQALTGKTLVTGFGNIVGTLEYMSPEQAEINQLDIDTRSDIYSLGVLLYELLAGSPPFTRKELEKVGMLEMLRMIREREPSKPSTKLSSSDALPTLSANRGTEPAKLTKLVRGELDWIVMKALEKDRNRRYETANGFAMDVQRYLADEAVQACLPSAGYRLRKFVRRNRAPVIAVSVILLCLVGGIIGTSAGLVWAVRERDEKLGAFLAQTKARDAEREARERAMAALRALTEDVVESQMARGAELTVQNKEFLRNIVKHFEGLAAITSDEAESRALRAEGHARVGRMRYHLGELKEAETALAEALALYRQLAADFPTRAEFRRLLAGIHDHLGTLFRVTRRLKEADAAYVEGVAILKQLTSDFPAAPEYRRDLATSLANRGAVHHAMGRLKEAVADHVDALALKKQLAAEIPNRPEIRSEVATIHNDLGLLHRQSGRMKEAESAYADALAIQKQLAADFPTRVEFRWELSQGYSQLGRLFRDTDRPSQAEAAFRDGLALQKQLAADFPTRPDYRYKLAGTYVHLGKVLSAMNRAKEAEAAHADGITLFKQLAADFPTRPEYRHDLSASQNTLGNLFYGTGRAKEAEAVYTEARAILVKLVADFPKWFQVRRDLAGSQHNLGVLLSNTGRPDEAEVAYADALASYRQLVAEFPDEPNLRNELAGPCGNLALLRLKQRDFKAARAYVDEAEPHLETAMKAEPREPAYRKSHRNILTTRIRSSAGLGDQAGAVQAAQKLRDLGWDPPGNAYDAAKYLALCIPIVRQDDRTTAEQRDKQAAFYGDEAMKLLREAVARGHKDAARPKRDPDFDALRERQDFQNLLTDLQDKKK